MPRAMTPLRLDEVIDALVERVGAAEAENEQLRARLERLEGVVTEPTVTELGAAIDVRSGPALGASLSVGRDCR
jgi:hypothetical protein